VPGEETRSSGVDNDLGKISSTFSSFCPFKNFHPPAYVNGDVVVKEWDSHQPNPSKVDRICRHNECLAINTPLTQIRLCNLTLEKLIIEFNFVFTILEKLCGWSWISHI
jgi:hypothetical protein